MTIPLTSITRNEVNNPKSTSETTKRISYELFPANILHYHERFTKFLLQLLIFPFFDTPSLKLFLNITKIQPCKARIYRSVVIKFHMKQMQIQDILIYSYLLFTLLLVFVVEAQQPDLLSGCPALSAIANVDSYNGSFCFCNVRDSGHVHINCLYSSTLEQFKKALLAVSAAKKTVQQVRFFFKSEKQTGLSDSSP